MRLKSGRKKDLRKEIKARKNEDLRVRCV